jgi:hypothetical protein
VICDYRAHIFTSEAGGFVLPVTHSDFLIDN